MTIEIPDLTGLSLVSFFGLLLLVAFADVATAIVVAIVRNTFATAAVLDYLRTHILLRVYVIFGLAIVGHGIPALGVPPINWAWLTAGVSLGGYVIETLGSLRDTLQSPPPPPAPAA